MNPTQLEALDPNTPPARLWELAVAAQHAELVDLLLVSVSSHHKIAVIKALKAVSHASLYTAKRWTDDVPCFINRRGVARDAAEKIQREINAAGGLMKLQAKVIPAEHAALVAQNPSAPLDLLWALGSCEDPALRGAILQHPLLPEPLLFFLGAEDPAMFLQNPMIQLAMLEDPEAFFRWPERVRAAILSLPALSEELLLRVIIGGPSSLRKIALAHPKISADFLRSLASRPDLDPDLHAEIAAHPTTSADVLARMAHSNFEAILGVLAQNPNSPPAVLQKLFEERGTVRNNLAQNPSTPRALLRTLANYGGEELIFSFQKNLTIDPLLLEELARDQSPPDETRYGREVAASHPNTRPETLVFLANDPGQPVVFAVAKNPSTPVATLEALVARRQPKLSEGVAQNPSAPGALLQQIIEQTAKDDWYQTIFLLAQNPSLTEETCTQYLSSMNFGTRRILAANTRHTKIIATLARDEGREIRVAVAQNPNTSQEILATLIEDPEDAVQKQARSRYRTIEWM